MLVPHLHKNSRLAFGYPLSCCLWRHSFRDVTIAFNAALWFKSLMNHRDITFVQRRHNLTALSFLWCHKYNNQGLLCRWEPIRTLDTKFTIARAGCVESSSANIWHVLSLDPICLRATKPNIQASGVPRAPVASHLLAGLFLFPVPSGSRPQNVTVAVG